MDEMDDANVPRCVRALRLLSQAGISLHELLDDVLMGDPKARGLKPVAEARSNLYKSGVLPRMLSCVRRPPDGMKIRGKQHKLAKNEIEKWANDTTVEVLQLELPQQAKSTQVADVESEVVNEDSLKELAFDAILKEVQENTPMLFDTLI
ncbi:hypothetical protein RSAG8_11502, partial [Rhizoctonia solani AG-8 WAC10335]